MRNIELRLLESVENLGIVGDVVKVKPGYARNFLLPMGLAEPPSPKKIEGLKEARARAQAEQSAQRSQREKLVSQLHEASVAIERTCNDQGALYGSVNQRDISDALIAAGFGVDVNAVRLNHAIRRIGTYPIPIQFARDLKTEITLIVKPDRSLEGFDDMGRPISRDEEAGHGHAAEAEPEPEPEPEPVAVAIEGAMEEESKPKGKGKRGKAEAEEKARKKK
jgi:large subunit ribosomal protein L9